MAEDGGWRMMMVEDGMLQGYTDLLFGLRAHVKAQISSVAGVFPLFPLGSVLPCPPTAQLLTSDRWDWARLNLGGR
jgi:hypothetical protein